MTDIDDEMDLALEKQEEHARDQKIECLMVSDLEFCVEQVGGVKALAELVLVIEKVNSYGHQYSVEELLKDFL